MTGSEALERRYRRLLVLYPRQFRREHGQEMLAVLMEGAAKGQSRPSLAESADLIRAALWMRLRPGVPRSTPTVFAAVRLMYAAAALELAGLITVLVTLNSVHSAYLQGHPYLTTARWHAMELSGALPVEAGAPVAAALWLWSAWANGRGHDWARILVVVLFGITTLGLASGLAQGAAAYALADVIAGGVLWLVALVAATLIFVKRSEAHYGRDSAMS